MHSLEWRDHLSKGGVAGVGQDELWDGLLIEPLNGSIKNLVVAVLCIKVRAAEHSAVMPAPWTARVKVHYVHERVARYLYVDGVVFVLVVVKVLTVAWTLYGKVATIYRCDYLWYTVCHTLEFECAL